MIELKNGIVCWGIMETVNALNRSGQTSSFCVDLVMEYDGVVC